MLHGYFKSRLPTLIDRWPDKWQREHPCWDTTRENGPHLCAITIAIGHCKSLINLRSCTSDDALFNNDTTRFRLVSKQSRALVGCYLYYDINLHRFVRSGKAYGRDATIGKRIDAHAAGSLKGGSRFYRMYPDRETHNSTGAAQVCGFHQDLKPYLGCAFDKEDKQAVKLLTTDISDGGILRWSQQGMELACKCPHGDTLVEKQLHIVSYMFEVMADIMIEPKHNMSDSGSFEIFLMGKKQT